MRHNGRSCASKVPLLLLIGLLMGSTLFVSPRPLSAATAEGDDTPSAERSRADLTALPNGLAVARTADGRQAIANRVVVGFKAGVSDDEKDDLHRTVANQSGVTALPAKQIADSVQTVDTTGAASLESVIQSYLADPRVRYAEPDYIVTALDMPNDQFFSNQYGMTKISAPAAWSVTHGTKTVKIAILDCGIYEAHPDLAGKVVARQDFSESGSTDDQCNHGTHVAGIASADTNNSVGVAGLGYDTSLLNGKVLNDSGSGYDTGIALGIRWAADHGANVINMSLGGSGACSQTFQDAIDYAWSKNVVVVVAAGNSGSNAPFQPADCTHVVAVASTDASDQKSGFSNFGSWVPVAAPGSSIYSTVNPNLNSGQSYAYFSGTSMASPHVAGLAGLLWSTGWGTSAQSVVNRLETTADHIAGTGQNWQYGRVNALAAVGSDSATPTTTSLSPSTAALGSAGFTLTITGTNFRSGATVLWNGDARAALSVTGTQVTTQVSASDLLTAGTVTITVANMDGSTSSPPLALTITVSPPQPTDLTPATGVSTGGAVVTIRGTAFQSGATVIFDGVAATVTSVTPTTIVVTAPAHAADTVNVVVTNPDGQNATLTNAFTYTTPVSGRPGPSIPAAAPSANPAPRPAPPPPASSGTGAPAPTPLPLPIHR